MSDNSSNSGRNIDIYDSFVEETYRVWDQQCDPADESKLIKTFSKERAVEIYVQNDLYGLETNMYDNPCRIMVEDQVGNLEEYIVIMKYEPVLIINPRTDILK